MVQVNQTPVTVRIKFKKVGDLQYISHLDLVRTMHKIIVRAGLPLWYSEGFNPKPRMTFAAPLSTGTQSVTEFMDLKLSERMDEQTVMQRLNANLTDDMQVLDVYYPTSKHAEMRWLRYRVDVTTDGASADVAERCRALFAKDTIEVMKKSKSGPHLVNIRDQIKSAEVFESSTGVVIDMILSSAPENFLNPENVIKALREQAGILSSGDLLSEYYTVMRTNAYREDMSDFV